MKKPMVNMGLMMAVRAAVTGLFNTGAIKVTPVVGRSTWSGLGPPRSPTERNYLNPGKAFQGKRECERRRIGGYAGREGQYK